MKKGYEAEKGKKEKDQNLGECRKGESEWRM